jgi:hypothetical protein
LLSQDGNFSRSVPVLRQLMLFTPLLHSQQKRLRQAIQYQLDI